MTTRDATSKSLADPVIVDVFDRAGLDTVQRRVVMETYHKQPPVRKARADAAEVHEFLSKVMRGDPVDNDDQGELRRARWRMDASKTLGAATGLIGAASGPGDLEDLLDADVVDETLGSLVPPSPLPALPAPAPLDEGVRVTGPTAGDMTPRQT